LGARGFYELGESNIFQLAFNEICARIDTLLIHESQLKFAMFGELRYFVATFVIMGDIPSARSLVFRVLDPFLNRLRTTDQSTSNV
jgi:hypothetical protein